MRHLLLIPCAFGLAGLAQAQGSLRALPAPSAPQDMGTYSAVRQQLIPTTGPGTAAGTAADCGLGRVYNNTTTSGFFVGATSGGNSIIDEGRLPSISGGGPADAYTVTGFAVAYVTDSPSVDIRYSFWESGVACSDLATLGTPTATFDLIGLPGSTTGMFAANLVNIDLTGGLEFDLAADGNGVFGDGDGDLFIWSTKVLNGAAGESTGLFIASDPDNCAAGSGTFLDTELGCDGIGSGSGLDTADLFFVEGDGPLAPGCINFGGYDSSLTPPMGLFGSFFLALESNVSNDGPDSALDLGMALGTLVSRNTCCSTSSGFNPCLTIGADSFYTWTAPMDGDVTLDTEGSDFDTRLAVLQGVDSTATCIGADDDDGTGLLSSLTFPVTAGTTYLFQLGGFLSQCGDLVANLEYFVDPCDVIPADMFEDNDDQASAVAIGDGSFLGLSAKLDDEDYYNTVICAGGTLTVDVLFIDAEGDIDLFLLATDGNELTSSESGSDNEAITFTNTGGDAMNVTILVSQFINTACSSYDMQVSGSCNVGTQYCPQNANSTGSAAQILLGGSFVAADDDLALTATNCPPNETGLFVFSITPTNIDLSLSGISDGILCLGSGRGRFLPIQGIDANGTMSLNDIDTTMLPQSSSPPVNIMTGTTGYFQAWFRDPGGMNGNNFTDAASITWL